MMHLKLPLLKYFYSTENISLNIFITLHNRTIILLINIINDILNMNNLFKFRKMQIRDKCNFIFVSIPNEMIKNDI